MKVYGTKNWNKLGDVEVNVNAAFMEYPGYTPELNIRLAQLPPAYNVDNLKVSVKYDPEYCAYNAHSGHGPITHHYETFTADYSGEHHISAGTQSIDFSIGFDIIKEGHTKFVIHVEGSIPNKTFEYDLDFEVKL